MTKKSSLPPILLQQSRRRVIWSGWKLVIILSMGLCVFALFRLHLSPPPETLLSRRRSSFSREVVFSGPPKVAYLFLVRRGLPLDFLWGSFFENADTGNFSIYVHSEPGFQFDESTTRSHFFYDRQLKNSIQVIWGESSMIEAERLLLDAALEDPANQRFVLLSDSCVPLYNFSYIYSYLMASPRSFVDSFLDVKEGRYHPKMSPVIPKDKWRKGSQWVALIRSHAEVIVDDVVILPVFKRLCKRRPPLDASKGKLNIKLQKQHNCIPDEHYVQTLLSMSGLEGELERRTVTYTVWNQSATKMENKGWHPMTFSYANASPRKIKEIKGINHIYYETEYRTEWCQTNSTFVPCFLFARKFSRGAAMRLLSEGIAGPFDASSILARSVPD
ncbi:CORE-2/I-BRANCHING BETA-16-N-ACETYLGLUCOSAMINYLTRANSFERASE FAMILY PROTEIN-RELATED [Salix purpurea]|uniref:CORE-2/I-BRANCHING BETA-16-N-ACETYLGLUCOSAMINYLTRANSFERASE FAMILY PROTEIN-RELATED n=1 Tax=Salix purpurea TaxID=77065 RepID=A0A9Q0WP91_SALPP|nr:CORE-2/I-BRANCHING BETA-16-N-ACETYLGLUCOSAMINYLTRANSFERASE FAMILY PROTEIN-RELATED [Salix purpurea]